MKLLLFAITLLLSISSRSQGNDSDKTSGNEPLPQRTTSDTGRTYRTEPSPVSISSDDQNKPWLAAAIGDNLFKYREDFTKNSIDLAKGTFALIWFIFSIYLYIKSRVSLNKISPSNTYGIDTFFYLLTYFTLIFFAGLLWLLFYLAYDKWLIQALFPFFMSVCLYPLGIATLNYIEFFSAASPNSETSQKQIKFSLVQSIIALASFISSVVTIIAYFFP